MRTSRPNASSQALPRTERLRRTVWLIFGSLVILTLVSCKPNTTAETTYIGGRTMGTTFSIKYAGSVAASDLFDAASAELERVDAQMSTYRADSELSRFNAQKSTEWFDVSLETAQVTKRALKVSKATDGAYDPTVHPLVELWGFGPSKSSRTKFTPPSEEQISATKKRVGYAKVEARLAPPALRKLEGQQAEGWVEPLGVGRWNAAPPRSNPRQQNLPVTVGVGEDGVDVLTPIEWSGSADIVGLATATAMAVVPPNETVETGERVEYRQLY